MARLIPFRFPGQDNVRCVFTLRRREEQNPYGGGNISLEVGDDPQAVRRCREELLGACGVKEWVELRQVHGTVVVHDPRSTDVDKPGSVEADGMSTCRKGLALLIKTADCQPLLITSRTGGFVAALHCGWKGNRLDFPGLAVREICRRRACAPEELLVVRGPSLSPRAAEFVRFEEEWGSAFAEFFDPLTRTMDLWRLTRAQLSAAGVPRRNMHALDLCTWSTPELFSHRRERPCGRQAALVWMV